MDLFAILQWTRLPRDVIELINRFVTHRGFPTGFRVIETIKNKKITDHCDSAICVSDIDDKTSRYYDLENFKFFGKEHGKDNRKLISKTKYTQIVEDMVCTTDICTGKSLLTDADIYNGYKRIVQTGSDCEEYDVKPTGELYYTSGKFVRLMISEMDDHDEEFYISGNGENYQVIEPESTLVQFNIDVNNCITMNTYKDLAVVYYRRRYRHLIFKNATKFEVNFACQFGDESAIFEKDGALYYVRMGYVPQPIDFDFCGVGLLDIVNYGDTIAFSVDNNVYIGMIIYG